MNQRHMLSNNFLFRGTNGLEEDTTSYSLDSRIMMRHLAGGDFSSLPIWFASFEQNSSTQCLVAPASINTPMFLVSHLHLT